MRYNKLSIPMRNLLLLLIFIASATAVLGQKADSSMYHQLKSNPEVLNVYYHTELFKTGKVKSEGWVYEKKLAGKKRLYRWGSWKEYYKNGVQIVQATFPADKGWVEHKRWDIMGYKEWESRIQVQSADEFAVSNLNKEFDAQNYFVKYFVDNRIESTGYFKNGQKDGTWKYYGKSGIVHKQEIYFNGGLLSTRKTEPTPTLSTSTSRLNP